MSIYVIYYLLFVGSVLFQTSSSSEPLLVSKISRIFEVDYANNQFLKDGEPFRFVSGSIHYFRIPRPYWRDRLKKMRACGLNAVTAYVEWSTIEPTPGKYNFRGGNDIEHFIKVAGEEDLLVILRVGPYICAERDLGGYPWWMFQKDPTMKLRTNSTIHNHFVLKWLSELLPRMEPLLYGNGGPIIMVQVENEYASYYACDKNYTNWLKDIFTRYVKEKAVLFTTDGYYIKNLTCGTIPNVLATVDFGPGTKPDVAFSKLKNVQKNGPLVNSEYYTGNNKHWGDKLWNVSTNGMIKTLKLILDTNASLSFYMFVGGTNFDFTSGANVFKKYVPCITSYHDYAPISEAGDPTSTYYAISKVIAQYIPVPHSPLPKPAPKGNYGVVQMVPQVSLFTLAKESSFHSEYPISFEKFNRGAGFVLYETKLQGSEPKVLEKCVIKDRANVFVDELPVGVLNRNFKLENKLILNAQTGEKLSILVENQGRVTYGYLREFKGILSNVTVSGIRQTNWELFAFPPDNLINLLGNYTSGNSTNNITLPAIYSGQLKLSENSSKILDTFIDMRGWGKGIVYVNGKNLGRYWASLGPQFTLYLPGCYLKQDNNILVFELEKAKADLTIKFSEQHIFNNTIPA